MRITIIILSLMLLLGCKKANEISLVYNVPAQFQPYVDSFIAQASTRGHHIVINNLIIQFDSSLSSLYCANSNVMSAKNDVQKIISINPHITCWQNSTQLETLIFHELGHCILGRSHDANLLPRGYPRSIMYPNDITLYSPCVYALGDSCNNLYRRTYYIDELFDSTASVPGWGK